jgi:hypothetical protein
MRHDHTHARASIRDSARLNHPAQRDLASGKAKAERQNYIVGPNGDVITVADLPKPSTTRWVIRRKAEVVLAVTSGLLTLDEACQRYRLTREEFFAWQAAIERHGLLGLRATHLKDYRTATRS